MNALLISPGFSSSFWLWTYLLKFVQKLAAFPPLGLLTVAAMLPKTWAKKLVDMNIEKLKDKDIKWADIIFIGAMGAQNSSAKEAIERCNKLRVPVVLGGHLLETEAMCKRFPGVSHFFLGEVEDTMPEFLADLKACRAKRIYKPQKFPDIKASPIPLYNLVNPKHYASGFVQMSRGCPYGCTFCNIAELNGREWRVKSPSQFLAELEAKHRAGFRGHVQIADDNFVGKTAKTIEILLLLIEWQESHNWPFEFTVEAPVIIADSPKLMRLMAKAGIKKVFLGLETRNEACLQECKKFQNLNRDLAECCRKIRRHGLIPMSGYIVGFDNDPPDTFADDTIAFIQDCGITMAMVDVLQAQPGTKLFEKLKQEGRLLRQALSNTDCYPNFVPAMPVGKLASGYRRILETAYSPKKYYERIRKFLEDYDVSSKPKKSLSTSDLAAFLRANLWIGVLGGARVSYYYWKSLLAVVFSKKWRAFADVVAQQIYGVHFRKVTQEIIGS